MIKSSIKRLVNSRFVRNVVMVGGGIAIGHAIVLIFMPFITRLYGPDAFGAAASFSAIANIVMPLATLGYATAIVMPESDEDASAIARLAILCGLIITPILLVMVYLAKPWLVVWTGMEQTPYMLYFIPISLLITSFLSVANQSAIRMHLFKAKARAKIESTLISNIAKLISGFFVPSGFTLIIFTLFEKLANFIMQLVHVPRKGVLKISNWFGLKGVKTAAKSQLDFAIYRMPQSLLNAVSVSLPVLLLSTFFGVNTAGQYSLAAMALGAPAMLIGQAIGEVFYPKITRAIKSKNSGAPQLLLKATIVLFTIGSIPFGVIFIWGDRLFPLIFGIEWALAGSYAQWISLWLLSVLTAGASVAALPALKLQGFLLVNEVVSVFLRVIAFYIAFYYLKSDIYAIALFSIVNVLINFSIIFYACSNVFKTNRSVI